MSRDKQPREIRVLDILFRDPSATYKAGDAVTGSVQLELAQELKAKAVRLVVQGIARVHWDEKRAYTKGSASKLSHQNDDPYLDETVFLVSKVDGGALKPGRHNWQFNVRLPPYLPASFDGQWGRVTYWAKVILERSSFSRDVEQLRYFTVQGMLDLNTDENAKKAIANTGDVMAGVLCCKSGPITGGLELEKRGYVCSQNIPFNITLQNESTKTLKEVRLVLSQQVVFRADKQVRKTNTAIKGLSRDDVGPGKTVSWESELKNIPPLPASRLGGGCKNIEVKYFLSLVAKPAGQGKALEIPVEIVIGTIPFRKTESSTPMLTVKAAVRKASLVDPETMPDTKAK